MKENLLILAFLNVIECNKLVTFRGILLLYALFFFILGGANPITDKGNSIYNMSSSLNSWAMHFLPKNAFFENKSLFYLFRPQNHLFEW